MQRTDISNLGLQPLDVKLRKEVRRHLWFSKFKGNITQEYDYNNDPVLKASGKPIEVNDKLKSIGIGDRLLIPMQKDLAGAPTLGDAVLIGREEPRARAYAKIGYNQVRHAVPIKLGEMDEARERAFRAAESELESLAWWHAQYENYNILTSIYEGASENLYTTKTNPDYGQGLGIPRRFHPNLYKFTGASDSAGALDKIGDAGKFPAASDIYTAASTSTTGLPMSSTTVNLARMKVMRMGIKPIVTDNGMKFWPWLLTLEQAYSLLKDETFGKMLQSNIWQGMKDHPWMSGALGYYGGFVFFTDILTVRGFAGAAGTDLNMLGTIPLIADSDLKQNPRFLPQEGHIKSSIGGSNKENHVSIIFGEGFLGEALHENLAFAYEEQDYGNWKGVAARTKYGYERLDFVPQAQVQYLEGTEAQVANNITNVYNKSSMLVMTWQ